MFTQSRCCCKERIRRHNPWLHCSFVAGFSMKGTILAIEQGRHSLAAIVRSQLFHRLGRISNQKLINEALKASSAPPSPSSRKLWVWLVGGAVIKSERSVKFLEMSYSGYPPGPPSAGGGYPGYPPTQAPGYPPGPPMGGGGMPQPGNPGYPPGPPGGAPQQVRV